MTAQLRVMTGSDPEAHEAAELAREMLTAYANWLPADSDATDLVQATCQRVRDHLLRNLQLVDYYVAASAALTRIAVSRVMATEDGHAPDTDDENRALVAGRVRETIEACVLAGWTF